MREEKSEGAGAAPTASGPDDANAESQALSPNANGRPAPASGASSDVNLNGAEILDRTLAFARRFISYPSGSAGIIHVLWIAHTHLMDAWFSTPRLAVLSPEPGSGKSRVLEITALLVPRPLLSVNSSAAFILRKIAEQESRPTVLYDEIDAIFGPNARGNEDLRAMINAGYRRGAVIGRCYLERGKVLTEELGTYAAVALGGLGHLPDTIMSRSVVLSMRKRAPGETVEPFRPSLHEADGNDLRDELATWAAGISDLAASATPELPAGIEDRVADVWSPLLTVAELAGGAWPDVARRAATEVLEAAKAKERPSLGVQLLMDIRNGFGESDRVATSDLLGMLLGDDEAPWGDIKGRKIDARKLAELLRPYGIRSSTIRMPDGSTPKGYKREAFHDTWKRYLPVPEPDATGATAATERDIPEEIASPGARNGRMSPPHGGDGEGIAQPTGYDSS